eukprot:232173_1
MEYKILNKQGIEYILNNINKYGVEVIHIFGESEESEDLMYVDDTVDITAQENNSTKDVIICANLYGFKGKQSGPIYLKNLINKSESYKGFKFGNSTQGKKK